MRYLTNATSVLATACVVATLLVCSIGPVQAQAVNRGRPTDQAKPPATKWRTLTVKASSYTLDPRETRASSDEVGAFGDKLSAADKVIAVSRDLLRQGLKAGTKVRIEGLKGTYTVLDVMHRRWKHEIDILFARRRRALNWGVQTVTIRYQPPSANATTPD